MTSRRGFLKSGALAVFGISVAGMPAFIARAGGSTKIPGLYKKK